MKKMITILVALSATVGLFAQGNNLITNGGFEKIVKRSLAQDKTLQNLTKRGWDFGAGPLVEMPNEWTPNASAGKVKLEIVKKAEKSKKRRKKKIFSVCDKRTPNLWYTLTKVGEFS